MDFSQGRPREKSSSPQTNSIVITACCNAGCNLNHNFSNINPFNAIFDSSENKPMRPSFDEIYMDLAVTLAKRSHCIKMQVGAVLAKDTRIISVGYNGPPPGTHNCDDEWPQHGCPRDSKGGCSLAIHAEQNAILYAAKNKASIEGATMYVTLSPCLACARIIFTAGIKNVFYFHSYGDYKKIASDECVDFLKKFGVNVQRLQVPERK